MAKHLNHEPQNIEYRMLNIEGKDNFIIGNSLFDIRYSKQRQLKGYLASENRRQMIGNLNS
jgi:hypothetical protein